MDAHRLEEFLAGRGFQRLPTNLPEFTVYYRVENTYANVLQVIDYTRGPHITPDQFAHIKETIAGTFRDRGLGDVHILSLILCDKVEQAKILSREDPYCWMLSADEDRLIIYENQAPEFYGMRYELENWLAGPVAENGEASSLAGVRNLPWVNIGLVAANVLLFLICTFTGELLYNKGAFSAVYLLSQKEYHRLITSMFLHAGIDHLVSNMLILYYLGEVAEKRLGHIRYLILYFLAGIGGNLISMTAELHTGQFVPSVGASGAIFGVVGALLFLVLLYRGRFEGITAGRIAFMIIYSLYSGFTSTNVNNAAHIGGLICGFALAFLLELSCRLMNKERGRRR